jgi:hypothetical protein
MTRRVALDPVFEVRAGRDELRTRQAVHAGGGSRHDAGDPEPIVQHAGVVLRVDLYWREPGQVQDAPEPIAAPHEMVASESSRETRVQPAENHGQTGSDDVGKRLVHAHDPIG